MARRHGSARKRPRQPQGTWFAAVLAVLVIAAAIVLVGVAAFVTIPASIALLVLVLGWPRGVGARIRGWASWRHVRGLEPERPRTIFAALLIVYGVLIPGACLAILVAAVRSGISGTTEAAQSPPSTLFSTPAQPWPSATIGSAAPATIAATPPPTPAPVAPTSAPPSPSSADPCHAGGVTYCVLNPGVTQTTIAQTICVSGWTASVRPPESYTEALKQRQIAEEGLPGGLSGYEEDHRMPLELGGAASDVMNLSPESPPPPNPKDADETRLKNAVCSGQLMLAQAQQQMVATWLAAYPRYRQ